MLVITAATIWHQIIPGVTGLLCMIWKSWTCRTQCIVDNVSSRENRMSSGENHIDIIVSSWPSNDYWYIIYVYVFFILWICPLIWGRQYLVHDKERGLQLWQKIEVKITIVVTRLLKTFLFFIFQYIKLSKNIKRTMCAMNNYSTTF